MHIVDCFIARIGLTICVHVEGNREICDTYK